MARASTTTESAQAPAGHTHKRPAAPTAPQHVLLTIKQAEQKKGLNGRLRTWVHRADCGDPEFAGLRVAIVRVGRSLFLSEAYLDSFIEQNRAAPAAPARNKRTK